MKNNFRLLTVIALVCGLAACSKETAVSSVSLNMTELDILESETTTLIATVSPDNASDKSIIWESSDKNVATVSDNGEVTAVSEGNATITVTTADGGMTAECKVTVNPINKFIYDGKTYICQDIKIFYNDESLGYDLVFSTKDLPGEYVKEKPEGDMFCIDIPGEHVGNTVKLEKEAISNNSWLFYFSFYIGDEEYYSDDDNDLSGTMYFDVDMDGWITLDINGTDNDGKEFRAHIHGHVPYSEDYAWGWL